MAACEIFPRIAHKTALCISVLHLPCPLLEPPTPILLEPTVLLQVWMRRGRTTATRDFFPAPRPQDGTLGFSIAHA